MREGINTEWKEIWRDEYMKTLCAFANTDGGVLKIGVDDRGLVVGVSDAKRLQEDVPNKVRDLLGIVVRIVLKKHTGKEFLEISVPQYAAPISYHGQFYCRVGSTTQQLSGVALHDFILKKNGLTWDGIEVPDLQAKDFFNDAFSIFREKAGKSGRMDSRIAKDTNENILENLNFIHNDRVNHAGVLTFHQTPEKWMPGAYIRIGRFDPDSVLIYQDEIRGPIIDQADKAIKTIYLNYMKARVSYEAITRVENYPVPLAALREAVLNAVVHRDYRSMNQIQIKIYNDRIYLWNPGTLPANWTTKSLVAPHSSQPRNPLIANAFARAGLIESWGRGVETIIEACRKAGLPEPEYAMDGEGLGLLIRTRQDCTIKAAEENGGTKTVLAVENPITPVETPVQNHQTPVETPVQNESHKLDTDTALLEIIKQEPHITMKKAAVVIGRSVSATERCAVRLQKEGRLKHIGANKGGCWKVID